MFNEDKYRNNFIEASSNKETLQNLSEGLQHRL